MTRTEFETFYKTNKRELTGFARFLVQDYDIANDVVSEVFMHIIAQGVETHLLHKNPMSFVRRAIYTHVKSRYWGAEDDKYRKGYAHELYTTTFSQLEERHIQVPVPPVEPDEPTPVEAAIRHALSTLAPVKHDIFVMQVYGRMSYKEIVEVLNERGVPRLRSVVKGKPWDEDLVDITLRRVKEYLRVHLESVGISARSCDGSRWDDSSDTAA